MNNNEKNHSILSIEKIKDSLNEIKELYLKIHHCFFQYLIFPEDDSKNIIDRYEKIFTSVKPENSNNINEYKSLSESIFQFHEKIKTSYENAKLDDLFNRLKEENNKLKKYKNLIDDEIINSSNLAEITPPLDLIENEEELIKKNNHSFTNDIDIDPKKINEDKKYQISLTCHICNDDKKEAYYICDNHCYFYFCDSCINKNDNSQHNFKKINKKKEKEKIECINSIFYIIKNYVEIANKIFKLNDENIEHILKISDKIDSQKEFLSGINNLFFNEYDSIDESIKQIISLPIKIFLEKTFGLQELRESSIEIKLNQSDLSSLGDDIYALFELKKETKEINEIKDAIVNLVSKYIIEKNIKSFQKEYENLINHSGESKIREFYHSTVDKIKNNSEVQEFTKDLKNFMNIFKKK